MDIYDFDERDEFPKKQNSIFKTKRDKNAQISARNFQDFKKHRSVEIKRDQPFLSKAQIDGKVKEEWARIGQQSLDASKSTVGARKAKPKPHCTKSIEIRDAVTTKREVFKPLFESPAKKQKVSTVLKKGTKTLNSCLFEASRKTSKPGADENYKTAKSERKISFRSEPEIKIISQNHSPIRNTQVISPDLGQDVEIPETPPQYQGFNGSKLLNSTPIKTKTNMASPDEYEVVSIITPKRDSASALFDISTDKEKDPFRFQKPTWYNEVVLDDVMDVNKYCLHKPDENHFVIESQSPSDKEVEPPVPAKTRITSTTIERVMATPPPVPAEIISVNSTKKKRSPLKVSSASTAPKLKTKSFRKYTVNARENDVNDSDPYGDGSEMNQGAGDVGKGVTEKVFGRSRKDYSKSNMQQARKVDIYKATPVTRSHKSPAIVGKAKNKSESKNKFEVKQKQRQNDTFTTEVNSSDSEEHSATRDVETETESESENPAALNYMEFIFKLALQLATKIAIVLIEKFNDTENDNQEDSEEGNGSSDSESYNGEIIEFTGNKHLNVILSKAKEEICKKFANIIYEKLMGENDSSNGSEIDDTLCDLFSQVTKT